MKPVQVRVTIELNNYKKLNNKVHKRGLGAKLDNEIYTI